MSTVVSAGATFSRIIFKVAKNYARKAKFLARKCVNRLTADYLVKKN